MRRILLLTSLTVVLIGPAVSTQQAPYQPSPSQPAPAKTVHTPAVPNTRAPRVTPVPSILVQSIPAPRTPEPPSTTFAPPAQSAQTPKPGQTSQTAEEYRAANDARMRNIKVDVTISDSISSDTQVRKTVTMLILDGRNGQVRSQGAADSLINIDASPQLRADGRIHLQLTVEYRPQLSGDQAKQAGTYSLAMFTESLVLMVPDGKPIIASQSSDPRSDRKVAVEVTATVLR